MTRRSAPTVAALTMMLMASACSPSGGSDAADGKGPSATTAAVERPIRPVLPMGRDCGVMDVPQLKGLVSDPADLIPETDELLIEQNLRAYQSATGHEAVAVMLPTLGGKDDGLVARCLGDAWSIGDDQRNDGVMILLVPSEERVRVAMGLGFGTPEESNQKAQAVINAMMPNLSRGDMVGGMKAGVGSLRGILP